MGNLYNAKVIRFKDKVEIIKYEQMKLRDKNMRNSNLSKPPDMSKEGTEKRARQQAYRVKRNIKYYAFANEFDKFFTLTFDDSKVDSTLYSECKKAITKWLKYQREKHGKFGYIFVPEFHKSGRIHFHGITKGFNPPMTKAKSHKTKRFIKSKGKQVYNVDGYGLGFSTVTKIENNDKTANYITKYITEDVMKIPVGYKEPRYLVSRGLEKPEIDYLTLGDNELNDYEPSFVSGSISDNTEEFEKDISIFHLDINDNGELLQEKRPQTIYKTKVKTPTAGVGPNC